MKFVEKGALDNLLCIQTINSPSKGTFFNDQGYPTSSSFTAQNEIGTKQYHYNMNELLGTETISTRSRQRDHSSFQVGDLIPLFTQKEDNTKPEMDIEDSFQYLYDGVLRLPSMGDGLFCNDLNLVEFGKDIEKSTCFRSVTEHNIEELCATSLRIDSFVSDQFGKKICRG